MSSATDRKVAVVIPAKNEADIIATTLRTCGAIPHVDLVVVVDDGSTDRTSDSARNAGKVTVVRHSYSYGKASAMETGAKVVAMRDPADGPPRNLLFLDADLGESAAEVGPLVEAVVSGETDCAIAALPPQPGAGGFGMVKGLGFKAIKYFTGWKPTQPLSGQRCITREAYEAVQPLATGWGVEVGMTLDLLSSGHSIKEIPCDLTHRASGKDLAGNLHRLSQLWGVFRAVMRHVLTGTKVRSSVISQVSAGQKDYGVYRLPVGN